MGRPRLIILIRHAQSEGNMNREIHQNVPDHRVPLTSEGRVQAHDAGRRLRDLLRPDDTLQFFTSPYRRTRETTEGILDTLTSDDEGPSPFRRTNIKVYEEPRLREQDFGNFQPCSAEMERMWQERADYGHFFYRIPNGESAADAYDRVSGFNESLWRQFGEDDFPSVCVLVTHGLMSRVFLMKWYHFTVEYFEDLRNVNHCEFLIMRKNQDNGKYKLENNLRTWSALRKERATIKAKEEKDTGIKKPLRQNSIPVARKWGGCPEGCNHSKHFKIRRELLELRQHDEDSAKTGHIHIHGHGHNHVGGSFVPKPPTRKNTMRQPNNSDDDSDDPRGHIAPPQIDVTKSREDMVSSPDGTPSYISIEDRLRHHGPKSPLKHNLLHIGRDFGGSYSGHASEEEFSEREMISEEDARKRLANRAERVKNANSNVDKATLWTNTNANNNSSISKDAAGKQQHLAVRSHHHVNRLGDVRGNSDQGSEDGGDETEDIDEAEKEERSVRESVY